MGGHADGTIVQNLAHRVCIAVRCLQYLVTTLALEVDGEILSVRVELVQLDRVGFVGVVSEVVLEGIGPDLVGVHIDAEETLSSELLGEEFLGMCVLEMDFLEDASELGQCLDTCCCHC